MTVEVKKESNRPANGGVPAVLLPKINLGLGIGTNSVRNQNRNIPMVCWQGVPVLTISQMNELQQQVLIHKHLVAGLRVPTNLLVPIWKSVARTGCSDFDDRHRSFVRFSSLGFDNGHMMDPEPGRCRRTDGKKWRCSRNIVPHQKYCERHMHRGRGRRCSRKPVETSETNSPSKTTLVNKTDREVGYVAAAPATTTSKRNKPANHFSCHIPAAITFPLITESIITSPKMVTETVTSSTHPTSTKATHTSCVDATKPVTMVPACAPITIAPHVTTVPSSITSCTIDLKDVCNMNCGEKYSKNQNDFRRNGLNVQKIPSPGFGFSPNSVLQVPGCSSSCYNSKINIELEPGRCRRTDGKRWRCRREIIPNHKYCGIHMHRGSKKHFKSSEKVANLATSATSSGITLLPLSMTPLAKAETTTLNTNLSMSIRAGDKQKHEEESNVSCSSETTITDTTITACENTSS